MSSDPPAADLHRGRTPSWSELPPARRAGAVAALVLVVLCCGAALVPFLGDESEPPEDFATESEPSDSASPTESEPTSGGPEPSETAASAASEPEPEPETEPESEPEPEVAQSEAAEVYYENCDAAREAGAAPVRSGEAGYRSGLDRDGDGVGCEDSSDSGDSGDGADGGGSGAHYDNCAEARAAGAAPLRRGDAGYGSHLDRDGDGVACE